jgi:tyrosyl-tRNA synthetase
MTNLVEELKWRGMVQDIMPGTEEQLNKEMTGAYVGFDPTAESLHIGHLVSIMLLKHLQLAGHKPFALVGGATGMIGDPSGKSEERNFLSEEVLRHNQESIKNQLSKFLDFNSSTNSAEIVNNYDWFKDFGFLWFLRDVGKHLTVNYMMAKDSVKKRLETGISFTEFSYQLLQGYDFYYLYKNKGVKLQMGGSDQWGNITGGTELIRRKDGGEAFAFTCPLITKADGTKFGKTEGGNVWLDPKLTSPYKFYQFWLNCSDEDSLKYIKIFTLIPREKIEELIEEHQKAPNLRILQKAMAEDITARVHSKEDLETALRASEILFGKSTKEDLLSLDEETLFGVFEGVPQISVKDSTLKEAKVIDLVSALTNNEIFPSKGEARKMIQGGGVSINKIKVETPEQEINFGLLKDKFMLVQKGKKNYYLLKVEKG